MARPEAARLSLAESTTQVTAMEEPSSFFRQEFEPRTVDERFQDSRLQMESFCPAESRFHGLFNDVPQSTARNFLLSKLCLNRPKEIEGGIENFDGNGSKQILWAHSVGQESDIQEEDGVSSHSIHGHLKIPSIDYGIGTARSIGNEPRSSTRQERFSRSRGFSSSRDGDETAEMWKRAIQAESMSRHHRRSTSSQRVITHNTRQDYSDHAQVPQAPRPSEDGRSSGSDSPVHSPTCTAPSTQKDEDTFRQSLVRSNTILEEWARQLEDQERTAKTESRALPSASSSVSKNSKTPPASWARFPSHNREGRNAVAGEMDSVTRKDFAVEEMSAAGELIWTTDKGDAGAPAHRNVARSLSDKLTQPFKSRWRKYGPGRLTTPSKDKSMRGKRRSSIQMSGILEYPELELLPTVGGYQEIQALQRGINEIKGLSGLESPTFCDNTGATTTRQSLTEKMARALQHDGNSDAGPSKATDATSFAQERSNFVRIYLSETPAMQVAHWDPVVTKDSTNSSQERYATPFTHLSSCTDDDSRPVTPGTIAQVLPTLQTPSSVNIHASVVRRGSFCSFKETSKLGTQVFRSGSWSGCDGSRQRSAPRANTAL